MLNFLFVCTHFPAASASADEATDPLRNLPDNEVGFHVNARQFYYHNSKVARFPVPEEKVPWEVFHIYISTKKKKKKNKITGCLTVCGLWLFDLTSFFSSDELHLIHASFL